MNISTTMKAITIVTYYGTIARIIPKSKMTPEVKAKCDEYRCIFASDPIIKILNERIRMFNTPTVVDEFVLGIISLCAYGNPVIAQMILLDLVHNAKNRESVGFDDFNRTFMEYPIAYDDNGNLTEIGETYKNRWDSMHGRTILDINEREKN